MSPWRVLVCDRRGGLRRRLLRTVCVGQHRDLTAVGSRFLRLEHIGSTSVPGLAAKPIIDMMASVQRPQDGLAARAVLAGLGYELVDTGMPD
jgi:GrpB-like predicted nucleotidyltransferase (UPF0157 family)